MEKLSIHVDPGLICLGFILVAARSDTHPSSVASMALCWALGPAWGGGAVFGGMTSAFGLGYGLGRLTPHSRLRSWVGPVLWNTTLARSRHLIVWIVLGRPTPVAPGMVLRALHQFDRGGIAGAPDAARLSTTSSSARPQCGVA